ncbi:hypothetical protein LZ588_08980 [Klebsiella pneumoniae]|uniref:hypothetical protein n=1 Tax=Klebsiella pneumoniae TaxID=573 RepID=UPI001F406552|nr:hypothetical protein [Klebsiella pneumoniae]MCF2841989.1 hypothetical protein [Klebsiella pneumoniae]
MRILLNITLLASFVFPLASKASTTDPIIIHPKNGETLEDSDRYTKQYFLCVKENAIRYTKTGESAEAIAKAAVSACENLIAKSTSSNIYWLNSSKLAQQEMIEKLRQYGENVGIKYAMDEKLKQAK